MSFLDDEIGQETSQPIEFFVIALPTKTYRHTSGNRDLSYNGDVFTALPIARTAIGVSASGNAKELTITLPINHPLVGEYVNFGVPPKTITATLYRKQVISGEVEVIWTGKVTALATEGKIAKLRVPSRASQVFLRVIPNVTVGKLCAHTLYDTMCGLDRNSFKISTTTIQVNGRIVRFDLGIVSPTGDDHTVTGELVHVPTGMRMTIASQTYVNPPSSSVVDVEMQFPIPNMHAGDAIEVYAGCNHTLDHCVFKFDNRQRFGGFPALPARNPFIPGSGGVRNL